MSSHSFLQTFRPTAVSYTHLDVYKRQGPLGVRQEYQNQGVGSCLVKESIQRARSAGYPWIVLLGGAYYSRFGFESGQPYGITVSDNPFENAHIQILFLDDKVKNEVSGKLIYCDAFYDERGNLL